MQFTDFLVSWNSVEGLTRILNMMPSMRTLLLEVGLAIPVAFQLTRPLIRAALEGGVDPLKAADNLRSWHPFGTEIMELLKECHNAEATRSISPAFLSIFWSLSLSDLSCPKSRYEAEVTRIEKEEVKMKLKERQDVSREKSYSSSSRNGGANSKKLSASLKIEMNQQFMHVEEVRAMIN